MAEAVSFASKIWGAGGDAADPAGLPAADMNDAADFQQWLKEAPPHADEADSSALSTILRAATSSLHEQEAEFDKTLRRVARTGDPLDGLAVQRQMSGLYLTHGLAVKAIGKTTQALETLTRLQ
jgi:hypothetical protein